MVPDVLFELFLDPKLITCFLGVIEYTAELCRIQGVVRVINHLGYFVDNESPSTQQRMLHSPNGLLSADDE
ncbi:hypothetical protein D3C85_1863780 [compost metagenome]